MILWELTSLKYAAQAGMLKIQVRASVTALNPNFIYQQHAGNSGRVPMLQSWTEFLLL